MGKISVSYYLNKKLKPEKGTDNKYSVYIRVVYKRELYRIKSEIVEKYLVSEDEFYSDPKIREEIDYETNIITCFIKYAESKKDNYVISESTTDFKTMLKWFNRPLVYLHLFNPILKIGRAHV